MKVISPALEPATTASARFLTVVQLIPRLHAGGAERSTLEIARALVQAGHRSVVISAGGRMVAQLQAEGSEHITLDLARKSLLTLARVRPLHRLLREISPDIVHARSRLPAWLGWLAMKGLMPRPHFVTTVHGLNSPGRYSAILLRGEKVIAVSQTLRNYLMSHYRWLESSRVRVIPRGIDAAAFPYGHRPDDAWKKAFFSRISGAGRCAAADASWPRHPPQGASRCDRAAGRSQAPRH